MHHGATSEVDGFDGRAGVPHTVHEAIDAPHHVREREVDQKHPAGHEENHGGEFHALGDRTHDQGGRDDREHHLIHREYILRNPEGVVRVRRAIDAFQKEEFRATEERAVETLPENQAVTKRPPQDGDEAGQAQTLRHDRQDVLRADQAAVKERQTGQRHEKHERRTRHHPCVVTGTSDAHGRSRQSGWDGQVAVLIFRSDFQRRRRVAVADIGFETSDALLQRRSRRRRRRSGCGSSSLGKSRHGGHERQTCREERSEEFDSKCIHRVGRNPL